VAVIIGRAPKPAFHPIYATPTIRLSAGHHPLHTGGRCRTKSTATANGKQAGDWQAHVARWGQRP
jgi:hypothetical protein